jgi:hypothetical protein
LFAIALRSFKLKQGHYPVTLAELKLEPGLTVDPYSGNSIIYKRFGNDYLLYGVGDDGKDDGGIPVNEAESPKIGDLGISRFYYNSQNGAIQSENFYKLIPHMLPPALPKGAPPLKQ